MKPNPILIELNAFTWMSRMKEKYGKRLTLASVPREEWIEMRSRGFDAVWLMGVWKRSPRARQLSLKIPELRAEFDRVLPGWTADDVGGSAYAVGDYTLDPFLGGPRDLGAARAVLNEVGLKLIVDFVPNHMALDHRWTLKLPEALVRPTPTARRAHPEWFFKPAGGVYLAYGRDPNFYPWIDTVQINAFSADARRAMRETLGRIAESADGVRCDMAMLMLNDLFKKTWTDCVADRAPGSGAEFWTDVLIPVKKDHPEFFAMAECYWKTGQKLLSLGFDAVYDKTLYDLFADGDSGRIQEYLHDSEEDQRRQVRFVENHDEPRVVTAFGRDRGLAAQAAILTLPGIKLFHQDQELGLTERVPVQLRRFAAGGTDGIFRGAAERLLEFLKRPAFHDGRWHLLTAHEAWPGSTAQRTILSWLWTRGHDFALVALNNGSDRGVARLRLPEGCFDGETVMLKDHADGVTYERQTRELTHEGLYVELGPWKYHLFAISRS